MAVNLGQWFQVQQIECLLLAVSQLMSLLNKHAVLLPLDAPKIFPYHSQNVEWSDYWVQLEAYFSAYQITEVADYLICKLTSKINMGNRLCSTVCESKMLL
ncbi:uncharacterized protein LOC126248739 isoform X2 [Schistocerca nitens]|uniref:uncharacterized protein LOC126248739 isoform X2 n=1 Tax=Schistocerca nitens TaxID=7011 RepID=UPI002118480C|nr:uncharacterized protein LOC126248739 isoform X2 [Schistocerca nitens]